MARLAVKFDVRGTDAVARRLEKLARRFKPAVTEEGLMQAARPVVERAKMELRSKVSGRGRGDLERGITAIPVRRGTVPEVRVGVAGDQGPLAHLVEFGTAPHNILQPRMRRVLRHPGQRAIPFLRPAKKLAESDARTAWAMFAERHLRAKLAR